MSLTRHDRLRWVRSGLGWVQVRVALWGIYDAESDSHLNRVEVCTGPVGLMVLLRYMCLGV